MFKLKNKFVFFKFDAMLSIGIISIGDELLIGQTVNTNASWMGESLALNGFKVRQVLTISDNESDILQAIQSQMKEHDVVLMTGGLGPTKDDITKQTLCTYFQTELVLNTEVLAHVEQFFANRNRPMLEVNTLQAMLPANCQVLFNNVGTAPGMLFKENGKTLISMPGVPYEMKFLMQEKVLPFLKSSFDHIDLSQKTYLTQGIGESFLAERLSDWENNLRAQGLDLAYLPSPGMVKLRITSTAGQVKQVEQVGEQLRTLIPAFLYGEDDQSLAEIIGQLLKTKKLSLATAESCTGGAIASELVKVSGASAYFLGGVVTYSNALKMQLCGVKEETLSKFGAVSAETVKEMASGVLKKTNASCSIAVSGIAGPDGGTPEKPVGLVWIAIALDSQVFAYQFHFGNNRERTIQSTVLSAMNLLRCHLEEIKIEKKIY